MQRDTWLPFNAWPSFADMMLVVVLILVILLASVIVVLTPDALEPTGPDITEVRRSQAQIVGEIARGLLQGDVPTDQVVVREENTASGQQEDLDRLTAESRTAQDDVERLIKKVEERLGEQDRTPGEHRLVIEGEGGPGPSRNVQIENSLHLQTLTFSEGVLFDSGESVLQERGKVLLRVVGTAIREHLQRIREVQIQGHTDNIPIAIGNMTLAANRAISVFEYFRQEVKVEPSRNLMSISSYGEYSPVDRQELGEYNQSKLEKHNGNEAQRRRNRRIELLLRFKEGIEGD